MQVKIEQIVPIIISLIGIIFFNSCDKPDDYSKIKKDFQVQDSLSLPVGKSELSLKFMGVNLDTNWQKFPDSLLSKLPAIKLNDTIPFDITSFGQIDDIKKLILFIHLTNDFPLLDTLNLMFADNYMNITKNITPMPIIIKAATFSGNDTFPKNPPEKDVPPIIFIRDSLKNWTDVKYIIINATLNNELTNKNLYNFFKDFYLHVEISLQVNFNFNTNSAK